MRKILLFFISTLFLFSDNNYLINNEYDKFITGEFNTYYLHRAVDLLNDKTKRQTIAVSTLQFNLEYDVDNWHFQATPVFFGYKTSDGEKLKNINFYKSHQTTEFFFRSFYLSYDFGEWSIGLGALPFSNSSTSKFHDDYVQDGEGINMLNDNTLTSIYALYETENSRTIFGIGTIDELLLSKGAYIEPALREGTVSAFVINNYTFGKYELISEFMYTDMKYNEKDISDIYLAGFSLAWDDSEESGLSLYGAVGGSIYQNNAINVKDELLEASSISPVGPLIYSNNFTFDNKTYYGASTLLGFRQDFDIQNEEFFINVEWFHTFGDWSSGNQGNLYDPAIGTQMYNIRDNSYYINLGYNINKDTQIRLSYSLLEFDETSTLGAPAVTVPNDDYIGEQRGDMQFFSVNFTYKF